jgi:hypothetical protein
MGKTFYIPEGTVFSEPPPPAPVPQPTPAEADANDARVRDLNNQFIDYKQQVLFTAPQAFLRQQGSDAIARAGEADEILDSLRQQTLDQAANAHQRTHLAGMLDWHLADAKERVRRHVVEQSDVWQQSVAARTVELATKQAALESGDAEKVGFVALAAYDAEKARALKAGLAPEIAHESGRGAWSGAYKAAIETQAGTDPLQAVKLFEHAKATLDPQTREALQPRIDDLSRGAQANALADKALAPGTNRAALLDDPAVPPEVRQLAENKIAMRETAASAVRAFQIDTLDSRLAHDTPQLMANANYVPGTYAAVANGYAATGDVEKTAAARQLAANETLLTGFAGMTPAYQDVTLGKLVSGPVRDQALRIKEASDKMLANDPLRWGTTTQRANGVGDLVPLDLTPSPTNTPQTIAAALAKREQQARQIETLSGSRTLAMTKEEIAAFKTALYAAPLEAKQKMLRSLATGLSIGATAHLASELAGQGPLADAYAIALSTYAAKRPEQDALADRILDGLDRMKAAGEGGKPVADTGPDWRQTFDEKIGGALDFLDDKNVAALRTAVAALYTQATALKGISGTVVDGNELDNSIRDILGGPIDDSGAGASAAVMLGDIARKAARLGQVAVQPYVDFYQRSLVDPLRRGLVLLAQSPLGDPGLYASLQGLGPPGTLAAGVGGFAAKGLRTVTGLSEAEKSARAAKILENTSRGRASESPVLKDLGFTKNTKPVETAEGRSIPDGLNETHSLEIKNSTYVSRTLQVRVQTDAASIDGRISILATGEKTKVSKPASKAFGLIIRRSDLGPQ